MKKYALITTATIFLAIAQPAIAATANLDPIDQLIQTLQNIAVPFFIIVSFVISLNILFSGELRFITLSSNKEETDWKELGLASLCSIMACSLPSLALGQFGPANVVLMLLNGAFIVFGLTLR